MLSQTESRWTILGPPFSNGRDKMVVAECSCGNIRVINIHSIQKKTSRSCGCFRIEWASNAFTTHGDSDSREYQTWNSMLDRCYNENFSGFKWYGGRGISVCQEWIDSYEAFLSHVGRRPSDNHTLDRFPNQNGDYEPGNVRWADKQQQANNRSTNRLLTIHDETKTVAEWSREIGVVDYKTAWERLNRGWNPEDALTSPSGSKRARIITAHGETKTLSEWSLAIGISVGAIWQRLNRGCSADDAVATPKNSHLGRQMIEIDGESRPINQWSEISGVSMGTIYRRLASGVNPKDAVFKKSRKEKSHAV